MLNIAADDAFAVEEETQPCECRTAEDDCKPEGFLGIIGGSEKMRQVFELIRRVADSDSTILISGETGTGKGLAAKAIHCCSHRKGKPFISINCGAIPENLLESELFGHVKGSFTGATANKVGKFERAHGGTIFLDEIGDMSPELQVKLLKVLEEGEFEPVGGTRTIKVDVRIIAATHRDLEEEVQKGTFREDLFYRLVRNPHPVAGIAASQIGHSTAGSRFFEKLQPQKQPANRRADRRGPSHPDESSLAGKRQGTEEHDRKNRRP